jgi:hypothetical protein
MKKKAKKDDEATCAIVTVKLSHYEPLQLIADTAKCSAKNCEKHATRGVSVKFSEDKSRAGWDLYCNRHAKRFVRKLDKWLKGAITTS